MSRVTLSLFAAAAVTFAAAGSANAQCCGSGYVAAAPVVSYSYPSACCNSGFAFTGSFGGISGCCGTGVAAAPVVVQAAPVVVQQPVIVRQPVVVQQVPVVQQYVVNQGPVYSGPALSDPRYGTYYAPRAVGAYPYVSGRGYGYRRAYYGHRYHRYHRPISVYN
jgi:hypothetical protein